jgi:hypothetical protein
MRFPIDVAYLSRDLRVVAVARMPRNRLGRNRLTARHTLEAPAGSLVKWGIGRGARIAIGEAWIGPT